MVFQGSLHSLQTSLSLPCPRRTLDKWYTSGQVFRLPLSSAKPLANAGNRRIRVLTG